jgi:hypothetical protein
MALSSKKLQAIELMAASTINNVEVMRQLNIPQRTFYKWKKEKEFMDALLARSRELLKESLPNVYNKLTELSVGGSHQHMKILLDHLEKLEEWASRADQGNITFTWSIPTQEEEEE